MKRRILSIITALALCLSLCPTWAFAAEGEPNTGLCDHHPVHTAECGYTAPTDGHPCGHEHTDKCYTEETLCVHTHDKTCYSDGELPAEGEDKVADACAHVCTEESGCITRTPDCHHAHDEECGYVQAGHGTPCGYKCPICPIEALIAALPDEVTEDNTDQVRSQLDEILALFSALSEDEQALVSISRCEALQEALDGAGEPDPAADKVVATVKIGNAEPKEFSNISTAWAEIKEETDHVVVTVSDSIYIYESLVVTAGQDVTVEITEGKTLTADATDCFQVKGGTLTLAGKGKVSVEARTTTSSVVYAQSGILKVTGGSYNSSYNCLRIDKDANVELTGGTFSAGNAELRYEGGRKVKEMLPPQYALSRDEKKVFLSDLDSEEFKKDGVYTVVPCKHEPKEGPIASNGNGTHGVNCLYCPYEQNYGPHEFTDGSGKCVICGAPRFAVTVTETTETGDGTSADYETIESAWAALEGKTGKVHVQDSVTITNPLTVGEGMNVTVTMGVGASITSEVADCFQVQGGTLTLESGTVVEKGDYKSAVSAESGTLNVTGGSYTSTNGNCLWIDEGADVELTGGTFTASGTLLRYENKTASDMLPQDFALSIDGTDTGRIPVSQFSSVTFSDSNVPYTVVACTYNEGCTSLGDGTHITGKCPYCSHGSDLNAQPAPHTFENGVCTACGAEARVRVVKDGQTTEYETIETAWKRGGEITLLKNVTTNETLSTRSIYSVTLKMEQGVTLTSTAGNCFDVYNNHSLTLDLTGGTVNCNNLVQINNGHFKVTGGTYNISGSGISSAANNDIQLSGGTFKASGRLLRYANKEVSAMLADGYSLETDSEKVPLDDLKQFNGSFGEFSGDGKTYTVTSCNHPSLTSSLVSNGDGTHSANCQYCSYRLDPVVHTYDPESGTCTGCHETLGVSVEHDGKTLYYENLDTAWPTILGMSETNNTATVTLLQSETRTASLLIGKDESPNKVSHNVTFKMANGVSLTNDGYSCFKVRNGKLTLDLNDNNTLVQKNNTESVVQVTGGAVDILGGKYVSAGKGIDLDSGGSANITGGTFKADGALLRYENNPVSEMLPVGYALQEVGGSKVQVNALKVLTGGNEGQFADEGKSYEVVPCTHEVRACSTNGDGTHNNTNCAYCRYQDTSASTSTPHTYDPVSGKCSECQSLLVASATVEGENILYYETLDTAWSSLNNKTGTVNLLTNVSIDHQFNVNEDTNVTLTMEDGVTLTDAAPQCFYVAVGGTLTLASGAVVATRSTGQELRHLVFNGGTLYVRGGTYTSTGGDCIIVNSGATAELTGGTFQAARNGTLLSFASVGHTVSELLPENYALAKGGNENEKVLLTALKETDTNRGVFSGNGDSYTVIKCNHDNATATKNNDGSTHAKTCLCCTHVDSEDPHTWSEDDNIVCTLCSAVAQAKVEMNDAITYYSEGASTGLEYAWQAVEGKTATITLLANTTTSNTLTVNSGDITLKMADGVALTHTGSTCFEVNGGTLTLPGGVKVTSSTGTLVDAKSGTLRVVGGEYTLGENTNGFVVGSGVDAKFSGGTIKLGTSSGNVLKYTGGQVKGLLETGYCLVKDGEAYRLDQLGSEVLSGLTGVNSLTLELCTHTTIENDQCALCGLKMVAKVAIGDDITYYDKLLDAWQAIQGKTAVLTLLNTAEAAETLTLSSGEVTLNMQEGVALNGTLQATGGKLQITGGKIGALTVSGDAQVSLSGGSFKSIHSDAPVARLLAAGYAYKQGNNWVYDTSSTSISSVEVATMVKLIPVEITAQPVDGTKTYGDTVTLSVTAQTVGGENDGKAITYQWYQVGESGSTAIASATGDTYSPVKLNAGAHKFYCAVICDEYMVKSSTVTVTVNPKPLTPSITGTATKNYDGTTDVTAELFIALAGVVTGDEVTATATYAYDNENAGENKTITASDIKLTGEDAGNYTLTLPTEGVTATGTISPLEITVTPDSGQHKEYGAADPALTYTVNPSLIGDDKLSGKLAYIGSAVGKYEITPGSLDVPTENYTLIVTTGVTFEITKANQAALHITGKPSGNIIYGDTFQLSTDGGSGTGTVIWTATGGATVDGSGNVTVNGTESATITATKAEDTNYEPTSTTLTFTPAKKALTVTGAAAENRAYNGTNRVTITGVTLAGIVNSDNVSVNTTGLTGTISGADAGDYTAVTLPVLTLTGGAAGNYTLTQPTKAVNTSVKVSKALASVLTPKDGDLAVANKRAYSYTYGLGALRPDLPAGMSFGSSAVTYELGAVSLGSYYGGSGAKIEGQTLTLPIEAVDNDKAEVIGTITVTIKSDNFEDMTATINVRSVNKTIPTGAPTLSAATLTYGQSLSTITLSGSMKDGSADVPGTFTWSSPDNRPAVQEAYAAAWVFKPDDNNTYAIVNGTSTIKVVPASVTGAVVTLSPTSFRYDGQTHSPTVTSVKLGDTTLTADTDYTVEIPTETAAGTYTVTVTGKGNYTGTAAATFTINPVEQKPLDQTDNAGHELRLEVETGLSTVPEALMNNETYNTPEKIEADLRTKVADVMTNVGENIAVFDVTLQYKDESGTWRTVVDPNDFPVEGVTAILPYPAGTGATGYTFTVQHLISSGTQAGTMETLSYTLTADGLQCKFSSLSPVAIGYQAAAKPVEPVDPNPGGGGVSTYAVTVEKSEHGKVTSNRTNAGNGSTVTLTVTPDSGYVLDTLTVTDSRGGEIKLAAQGNGKYTFTMPGRAVTVKAAFAPLPDGTACDGGESCPSRGFTDLGSVGTWYHEAVDYVLRNNLMGGYGNGMFGPNDNITRAQFAQILYNKEGRPNLTGGGIFTDVAPGAWCAPAITWAAEHGIVGGYGDGMFGPNDKITREQLAVMLWRYAGNPAATNKELHFNDANEISGFALEALQWAVENGVMGGYDDGRLDPKGLATRAQVAQMFKNFMESQEEVED